MAEAGTASPRPLAVSMLPRAKAPTLRPSLSPRKMRTRPRRVALSTSGEMSRTVPSSVPTPVTSTRAVWPMRMAAMRVSVTSASSSISPLATMRNIGAAAAPGELAPLGLDLSLLGLRGREPIAGSDELGLCRARGLLARVVGALGHDARLAQRLGALEGVAALNQTRFGLHDAAARLGDGCGGTRERSVILRELSVKRVGDEARQHVPVFYAHALIRQHLRDAQA